MEALSHCHSMGAKYSTHASCPAGHTKGTLPRGDPKAVLPIVPSASSFHFRCSLRVLCFNATECAVAVAYFMHVLLSCSVLWTFYDPIYGVNFTICYAKNRVTFIKCFIH